MKLRIENETLKKAKRNYVIYNELNASIANIKKGIIEFNALDNYDKAVWAYKPTNSGKYGNVFEIAVKQYFNGTRGNAFSVSAKGKTDFIYHGFKFESKSNCGELIDIEKNDYVVYTMDNKTNYKHPEEGRVIPAYLFVPMIAQCGLLRKSKKSTNGYRHNAIQSYSNSKRKSEYLEKLLYGFPTVAEWKERSKDVYKK